MVYRSLLIPCALAAGPAFAAPLSFGAITAEADLSASNELSGCSASGGGQVCRLRRTSFGELSLNASEIVLNGAGRPVALTMRLDRADFDRARQMLVGRYGPARDTEGRAQWTGFSDGGRMTLDRGETTTVRFDFPANAAATPAAGPNSALIWSVVGFAAAGLASGSALHRWRRRRQEPASERPMSMRAVLERRVQEGRDFHV